ncbi:MAG: LPXTG cell wall anchor domain-containing protein [Hymenobacter sp.]|nr:MAG: LPXTG cell wall anchor domain-containing protein [Hymenobacter sp.]
MAAGALALLGGAGWLGQRRK